MERIDIKTLEIGKTYEGTLAVSSCDIAKTKPNKFGQVNNYLKLVLTDGKLKINVMCWSNNMTDYIPANGDLIDVSLQIGEYDGKMNAIINSYSKSEMDMNDFCFIDLAKGENAYAEIMNIIDDLDQNDEVVVVTKKLLTKFENEIKYGAGAKSVHHDYKGGLAVHISEVLQCCEAVYPIVKNEYIDYNILICGAALHDIGKVYVYKQTGLAIDKTDEGYMFEHLALGFHMLLSECDAQSSERLRKLGHVILSHHGKLEYGSPVKTVIPEAMIINKCDGISAEVETHRSKVDAITTDSKWSSYDIITEKYYYKSEDVQYPSALEAMNLW